MNCRREGGRGGQIGWPKKGKREGVERETGDGEEGRGQEEGQRGEGKGEGKGRKDRRRRMGKRRSRQRGRGDKYKCLCSHLRLVEQYQVVKPIILYL